MRDAELTMSTFLQMKMTFQCIDDIDEQQIISNQNSNASFTPSLVSSSTTTTTTTAIGETSLSSQICSTKRERRVRKRSITLLQLNLTRLNIIKYCYDYFSRTLDSGIDFFASSYMSAVAVRRLSIGILIFHSVFLYLPPLLVQLEQSYQEQLNSSNYSSNNATTSHQHSFQELNPATWTSPPLDWALPLHVLFYWILPILCSLSGCSFVAALCFHWNTTEAAVLAGLIALFLVECLVPLAATVSTALYFLHALTGPTTCSMTLSVWVVCVLCSMGIRCCLYPRLGQS